MSTHLLGDVQLVTLQEVEAMLDTVVVPESAIDKKVNTAKTGLDAKIESVMTAVSSEGTARELADKELLAMVKDEAKLRNDAVDTLQANLEQEVSHSKQADEALLKDIKREKAEREEAGKEIRESVESLKDIETEELSNLKCLRFKNLPIATIQVDNDDKSLKVGDTVATVTDKYRPAVPVDFPMTAEQVRDGKTSTWLVLLRLDAAGNVNVVNMFKAADGSAATDTATVTYITRS